MKLTSVFKILLVFIFTICGRSLSAEELVFWNFWEPRHIQPIIEKFEAENPGVKIKNEQLTWNNGLDKIVISIANNRTPDICEMGSTWMGKFMSEGALLDMTEELAPLKDKYIMWEPVQMNGRLYGMPWLAGTRVMFYNKELVARAGFNPEKPPVTWAELYEMCKAIHNPQKGVFGFGMNAGEGHILYKKFLPLAWGNGARIFDDKGNFVFDGKEMKEALEFYLKLQKFSFCEKQDLIDEAFKQGKLGFTLSGSWNFSRYPIDAPNLDFGTCLIPKPSETKGFSTSFMGGEIVALFKSCKNPKMASKFVKFLVEGQNTLPITKDTWSSFPASKDSYSDSCFSDPRLQVFCEQMKTGIHPPVHKLWIEIEKIINNTVEKAMYGEPIDKVFAEAKKEYNRISHTSAEKEASASAPATRSAVPESQNSLLVILLGLIGVGTLINAVLMSFILYELKKKG